MKRKPIKLNLGSEQVDHFLSQLMTQRQRNSIGKIGDKLSLDIELSLFKAIERKRYQK